MLSISEVPSPVQGAVTYSDWLNKPVPATYNPANAGNILTGASGDQYPSETLYVGLIVAPTWSSGQAATVNQTYVTGSQFGTTYGQSNRHIYLCKTSGFSGTNEPSWNTSPGGITYDDNGTNTIRWEEVTNRFNLGNFAYAEPTDMNYQRAPLTNTTVNYLNIVDLNPTVSWPTSSSVASGYGGVSGYFLSTSSSGGVGTILNWGLLANTTTNIASTPVAMTLGSSTPVASLIQYESEGITIASTLTIDLANVQSSSLLVAEVCTQPGASVGSISDNASTTWTKVVRSSYSTASLKVGIEWWQGMPTNGGNVAASVSIVGGGGAGDYVGATIYEIGNAASVSAGYTNAGSVGAVGGVNPSFGSMAIYTPGTLAFMGLYLETLPAVFPFVTSVNPGSDWTGLTGLTLNGAAVNPTLFVNTSIPTQAGYWNVTTGGGGTGWVIAGVIVTPQSYPTR